MAAVDTREQILDAAEDLFAAGGFHGTSVRSITREAGVNLASVNYHFGSKEALIEAVFERRFGPVNRLRVERMERIISEAEKTGAAPEVRQVLRAFISPLFEGQGNMGCLGKMSSLIQMAHSGQEAKVMSILIKFFGPVIDSLFRALRRALPGIDEEELKWKVHLVIGGFSHTIRLSHIDLKGVRAPILPKELKRNRMIEMMVSFFAAGMEAI